MCKWITRKTRPRKETRDLAGRETGRRGSREKESKITKKREITRDAVAVLRMHAAQVSPRKGHKKARKNDIIQSTPRMQEQQLSTTCV
jgi:hypothetical protein